MATAIVWDDDPAVEPQPPTAVETYEEAVKGGYVSKPTKAPTTIKEALEWADINDLIAELNKRGMVVSAMPSSYYMPATITTPTITTTSGTFTMPSMGGLGSATCEYYSRLIQNVTTLGKASPPLHSELAAAEPPKSASLSTWKALIGRDK